MCDALASMLLPIADLPVEIFQLKISDPVGLAAGMDEQAAAVPSLGRAGFVVSAN